MTDRKSLSNVTPIRGQEICNLPFERVPQSADDSGFGSISACHPPHFTEFLAEEMGARGWSEDVLVTMLMVQRHPKEWGKIKLEMDLWRVVGPTTRKILFKEEFARELASVFGVSHEFFMNMHKAWMERGQLQPRDGAPPS